MDGTVASAVAVEVPGIVAVPEVGVGMPVINKERWEEVRRLRALGHSVSEIARTIGFDRKTVRSCLRQAEWMPYRRAPMTDTLLATHQAWLVERAPLVNYSARILFQELRATRGYEGSYDTVRDAVRPLRTEGAAASLTQCRFETEPGHQGQVDWGEVQVQFATGRTKVHVFVMTLGYSRRAWAEGYENERMASLLAAHEHAFAHFGGRPAELLYDRMRTVTMKPQAKKGQWNPTFESFFRYWGFEPRLCPAYRARALTLDRPDRCILRSRTRMAEQDHGGRKYRHLDTRAAWDEHVRVGTRGVVFHAAEEVHKALDDLKKAVDIAPQNPTVHYNLASLYSLQGSTDFALDEIDASLTRGFSNYDALRRDTDLHNVRRHPEFRKILEKQLHWTKLPRGT